MLEEIKQIFSLLCALRENLPTDYEIPEKYVNEYMRLLVLLEKIIGIKLNNFYVLFEQKAYFEQPPYQPQSEYEGGGDGGGRIRGSYRFCERPFFLTKLDALISCFHVEQEKLEIGFIPPKK